MIYKSFPAHAVKGARSRTFTFTASTGELDRDHDRIPPAAWWLDRFQENPVILWQHQNALPPIARALDVRVSGKSLKADIEFPPEGIHELADTVHGLVEAGFLKATSVGFRPSTSVANQHGGRDYEYPVELLEISVVNLPANTGALLERRECDYAACGKWLKGEQEASMGHHYHPHDVVLAITDPPPPRSRNARRADEFYRQRQLTEWRETKGRVILALQAGPAHPSGRTVRLDDPELPEHLRWIPALDVR